MYNTKVICTYNTSEVFLESDEINESEKEFIRDSIYRQELLNILGIEEYNENEMNTAINKLYIKLLGSNELRDCMAKMAAQFLCEDLELGLMLLYAYDYMYLSHTCVSEYLETGTISHENMSKLKVLIHL